MKDANAAITQTRPLSFGFDSSVGRTLHRGNAKVVGSSRLKPDFFQSGHFSSSVRAAFVSFILSYIFGFGYR